MQNTENQPLGGGGLLKPRARQKMRDYCQRYNRCTIADLPRIKKFPYARLLADVYGFPAKEIAAFFDTSVSSAYRLVTDARFQRKYSRRQVEEEQKIADYILYNAQWKGGITIT